MEGAAARPGGRARRGPALGLGRAAVSRLAKRALVQDKKALRAELERFAQLPRLTRLIVAHEKVASGPDAKAALLRAAEYL
jgi:hypothetical protein